MTRAREMRGDAFVVDKTLLKEHSHLPLQWQVHGRRHLQHGGQGPRTLLQGPAHHPGIGDVEMVFL